MSGLGDPVSDLDNDVSECADRWDPLDGDLLAALLPTYVFSCIHLFVVESIPTIAGGVTGLALPLAVRGVITLPDPC